MRRRAAAGVKATKRVASLPAAAQDEVVSV